MARMNRPANQWSKTERLRHEPHQPVPRQRAQAQEGEVEVADVVAAQQHPAGGRQVRRAAQLEPEAEGPEDDERQPDHQAVRDVAAVRAAAEQPGPDDVTQAGRVHAIVHGRNLAPGRSDRRGGPGARSGAGDGVPDDLGEVPGARVHPPLPLCPGAPPLQLGDARGDALLVAGVGQRGADVPRAGRAGPRRPRAGRPGEPGARSSPASPERPARQAASRSSSPRTAGAGTAVGGIAGRRLDQGRGSARRG